MIQEITTNIDGEIEILKWEPIAVQDYGSEGTAPLHRADCPIKDGHVSCVSGSGSSICGGFYGHAGAHVVRCTYPQES
jgi:hypothetical protein